MAPARGRFGLRASFYAAEVLLATKHAMRRRSLSRPRGIKCALVARRACKLTDFGFAKVVKGKTFTYCGTPHAMAPEVLRCKVVDGSAGCDGYDHRVDWWSFGILCYEMLVGQPPAGYVDSAEMAASILEGFPNAPYPEDMFEIQRPSAKSDRDSLVDKPDDTQEEFCDGSESGSCARDLIQRCLRVNPDNRLRQTAAANDSTAIDEHPWLRASVASARAWAASRAAGHSPSSPRSFTTPPSLNRKFFSVTEHDEEPEGARTLTKAEQDMFADF